MAKANFWQRGETLDYVNSGSAKIEAGTVIELGSKIGIAGGDIAVGETGSIHVVGVFEFPKTDSTAINAGTAVYWDGDGITATASTNTPAGYAAYTAAASATTVLVKINA